jgi:hypothetical protein
MVTQARLVLSVAGGSDLFVSLRADGVYTRPLATLRIDAEGADALRNGGIEVAEVRTTKAFSPARAQALSEVFSQLENVAGEVKRAAQKAAEVEETEAST